MSAEQLCVYVLYLKNVNWTIWKPGKELNSTNVNFNTISLVWKLNTLRISNEEKSIHLQNYDKLALKMFIKGFSGQIQTDVRLRNPNSLEKPVSLVTEEENFIYF